MHLDELADGSWVSFVATWEPRTRWETFEAKLSIAEARRAASIPSPAEATRYAVGRALTRHVLRSVSEGHDGPRTSVTHSGECAMLGVTNLLHIGVDIVDLRRPAIPAVLRLMTGEERRILERLPPEQRLRASSEMWAIKEAFGKATGRGLTAPFPPHVDDSRRFGAAGGLRWCLLDLGGYVGAIAWSGQPDAGKVVVVEVDELA